MNESAMGVIKKDSVKPTGSCLIGPMARAAPAGGDATQARIVEQDDTHAVIEVTCACGKKSYLRCNFAAEQA